jgi:hypothetical protein
MLRREGADMVFYHWDGAWKSLSDTGSLAVGVPKIFAADWDGTHTHLWTNGTLKGTAASTSIPSAGTRTTIGDEPGIGNYADGHIPDILVYNKTLSDTERQSVLSYLSSKYAITVAGGLKMAVRLAGRLIVTGEIEPEG